MRPDVTEYFSEFNYNLDESGFSGLVDLSTLYKGKWDIVIAVTDENGMIHFQVTNQSFEIH